jgi:hypothetical protein
MSLRLLASVRDMTIEPDTKDWTWVLREPCPECGFDAATVQPARVGADTRQYAAEWVEVLDGDVRGRPSPDVWSPLEYGCHVRDVFTLFNTRLGLMLDQEDPLFPNWDQDETAVAERYGEQDPTVVAPALSAAGNALADRFDALEAEQWSRTGRRSDGAVFTVDSFARYFLHDPFHHLHDVRR